MQRQTILIAIVIIAAFALCARAGLPTTQPNMRAFSLYPEHSSGQEMRTQKTREPLEIPRFEIKYQLPTYNPLVAAYIGNRNGAAMPTSKQSSSQNRRSFNLNGQQVWERPAIQNITPNLIKDATTGQTYTVRDSIDHVDIKPIPQTLQDNLGTYIRSGSYRQDLDLLDDRGQRK